MSYLLRTFSISDTTSMPFVTRPNTVCLPSNFGMAAVVMKNCDPFVLGALAFAIDTVPGLSCLSDR